MSDTDEPQYRQHYQPDPDDVDVREDIEDDDGMFGVRMPIASTGEVRNERDDPLTRDELEGMARQLDSRQVGAFPNHGSDPKIAGGQYSPFEKLGYWDAGEVETRDEGADVLVAEARMPDPETLPAATGQFREGLAILKEQAERGIALSSSIGWREDEDAPGGNDLMEASIVGIPADPRTDSAQDGPTEVLARAAIDAGAEPSAFVDAVRDAVMGSTTHDTMTDSDDESADEQSADTDDEQSDAPDAESFRSEMLEMQRQQTETLSTLADALRQDDDEDDDDDDDEEDQEGDTDDEDDDEDEQSADGDLEERIAELTEALDAIRSGDADVDTPDTPDADEGDDEQRNTTTNGDNLEKYEIN